MKLNLTDQCIEWKSPTHRIKYTCQIIRYSISHPIACIDESPLYEIDRLISTSEYILYRDFLSISSIDLIFSSCCNMSELSEYLFDESIRTGCDTGYIRIFGNHTSTYLIECCISHIHHTTNQWSLWTFFEKLYHIAKLIRISWADHLSSILCP